MSKTNFDELLDAGVHFGHLKRKWNPNMAPYIFMERNGIHIIDLHKTMAKIDEASSAMKQIAKSGKKILFVATKKQAKQIVAERVQKTGMPFMTERWPGGMLTNFSTIRKAVRKMSTIDKMMDQKEFTSLSKREKLQISRERAKLEKNLGSISDLSRLPAALFIVDINNEKIAVAEARKLNIPIFAMTDTNTNPTIIDFPIPSNDDATKSISLIIDVVSTSVEEGLAERKMEREKRAADEAEAKKAAAERKKAQAEKEAKIKADAAAKAKAAEQAPEVKSEEKSEDK